MASFDPLPARVVADIESGILAPGESLSQRKFGKLYGVGRGVARRVLKFLLDSGYIEFSESDLTGDYVVTPYTDAVRQQAIELKILLETYVTKKILKRVSKPLIMRLKAMNRDMLAAIDAGDLREAILINRRFHEYLMETVNRGPLGRMFDVLYRDASSYVHESYDALDEAFLAVCEHAVIIDALETGHKAQLIEIVKIHVRKGFEAERQAGPLVEKQRRRTGCD
ncbi:GntR family transcriptional regulator [Kordiimonas pumila]|uniref:GntR family transcriptional regulator n=1 Tax=Kordiimonas pumila TaxID=2161677 RepID=A0ABV7D634_9PROT|nr:GntR family transcriptional regulator [Kordiimonas pumila]